MKSLILLTSMLLIFIGISAEDLKNLQAKNAVDRYKTELKKAEDIKEAAEVRYKKDLNEALTTTMKMGDLEEANKIKALLDGNSVNEIAKEDVASKSIDKKIMIPKNIAWENVSKTKSVKSLLTIQDIANGHDAEKIMTYIRNATYKEEIFGKKASIQLLDKDGQLSFNAAHNNSSYIVFYINSLKDTEIDLEFVYNSYATVKYFLDFENAGSGKAGYGSTKLTLTKGVHVFIVEYVNTWAGAPFKIKFPDAALQIGTPKI